MKKWRNLSKYPFIDVKGLVYKVGQAHEIDYLPEATPKFLTLEEMQKEAPKAKAKATEK